MRLELGCCVTALNLCISTSVIDDKIKYVPTFLASGGRLVEYCVMSRNPTPLFPNVLMQVTRFFAFSNLVSSSTTRSFS